MAPANHTQAIGSRVVQSRDKMAMNARHRASRWKWLVLCAAAIALGWPDVGKMVIKSLAKTADPKQNNIKKVELLGRKSKLQFRQTADGLVVELPGEKLSDLTCSLRITGSNLKPASLLAATAGR